MSAGTMEMTTTADDVAEPVCIPDSICFFAVPEGMSAAKYIDTDGTVHLPSLCKIFDAQEISVAGLTELGIRLRRMLGQPRAFVVRGRLVGGPERKGIRRLANAQEDTPATLVEHPRRWLALDMDGVVLPSDIKVTDLRACAREAIKVLPPEFHGVHVVAQASASHGIKPGARLRLWFWLSRPVGAAELKTWFAGVPFADKSVFETVQPIYTAAPVFADGIADHIPCRMVEVPGDAVVVVPPINVPPRSSQSLARGSTSGSGTADIADVIAALDVIPIYILDVAPALS